MAKTFTGTVKSNKTDKTIVVIVQTRKNHPIYRKQYTDSRNFMAHDEKNEAMVGDRVTIAESRPISRQKRFVLKEIVEKAPVRHEEPAPGTEVAEKAAKEEKTS
jgi:small subunit ribosomal protein S17